MQTIDKQWAHLLALAEPILARLDESHRALEPVPGAKTAGWLVGHLAVSGDYAPIVRPRSAVPRILVRGLRPRRGRPPGSGRSGAPTPWRPEASLEIR